MGPKKRQMCKTVDRCAKLYEAASNGNCETLEHLLQSGIPADELNSKKRTVLQRLAIDIKVNSFSEEVALQVFQLLINYGAEVNRNDLQGNSVLHLAIKHRCFKTASLLVGLGADPNRKDGEGFTAVHRLAMSDCKQKKCLETMSSLLTLILPTGTEASVLCPERKRIMLLAAEHRNWNIVHVLLVKEDLLFLEPSECLSLLNKLAAAGIKWNVSIKEICDRLTTQASVDCIGALQHAAKLQKWDMVSHLLSKVSDADFVDEEHFSLLHRLALTKPKPLRKGNVRIKILKKALQRGANMSSEDEQGDTPFHLMAKNRLWEMVDVTLSCVTDINKLDSEGFCILHRIAQEQVHSKKEGRGKLKLITRLLKQGADIDSPASCQDTALHIAVKSSNWLIAEELVNKGAHTDLCDGEHRTVLHTLAAFTPLRSYDSLYASYSNVVATLFQNKHLLSTQDSHKNTALHVAAKCNNLDLVKMFILHQADSNLKDGEGFSVLHRLTSNLTETSHYYSRRSSESSELTILKDLLDRGAKSDEKSPTGDRAVHFAANKKRWDVVEELVKRGADVNVSDSNGYYVVHRLVMCSCYDCPHEQLLQLLFTYGAQFDVLCSNECNVLCLAAEKENWNMVKWLLENKLVSCCLDKEQQTLLHHLTASKKLSNNCDWYKELCDLTINCGVDVNAKDKHGNTALHLAAKLTEWDKVEYLIKRGSAITSRDDENMTLLIRIANDEMNNVRIDLLNEILGHDVQLDETDPRGNTPLNIAAKTGKWEMVEALIQSGAEVNTPDDENFLPIHRLTIFDNSYYHRHYIYGKSNVIYDSTLQIHILDIIIDRVNYINEKDPHGYTSIQLAAKYGHWKVLEKLLPFIDDVNEKDIEGFTILHRVSSAKLSYSDVEKKEEIVIICHFISFLHDKGAQLDLTCSSGNTAVHMAAKSNNWPAVEELLDRGASAEIFDNEHFLLIHRLAKVPQYSECEARVLRKIISTGIDINLLDPHGMSALQSAAKTGKWKTVVFLIESGARVEPFYQNGETLFHWLAMYTPANDDATYLVQLFLKHGININYRNETGNTALHITYKYHKIALFKTLLHNGADPRICDNNGHSVIYNVCSVSSASYLSYYSSDIHEILTALTESGLNINYKGLDGKTAFQVALQCQKWEVFGILISLGAEYNLTENEKCLVLRNLHGPLQKNISASKLEAFLKHVISNERSEAINHDLSEEMREATDSALWKAVSEGSWDMVSNLLRFGVNINVNYSYHWVPIIHCLVKFYKHEKRNQWLSFLSTLVSHKIDLDTRDKNGMTILQKIVQQTWDIEGIPEIDSVIPVLIQQGACPLVVDENGFTLLRSAVEPKNTHRRNIINIVNVLVESGMTTHQPRFTEMASRAPDCRLPSTHQTVSPTPRVASPTQFILEADDENSIHVLKKLIEAGASSNSELYRLYKCFKRKIAQNVQRSVNGEKKLQLLRKTACFPRSLKSLCRLTISHVVRCGPQRQKRVATLPLPSSLKDYVMFCDVVSLRVCTQEADPCFE